MSRVTELEKALTTLFRKGTEVGYTETEMWRVSKLSRRLISPPVPTKSLPTR